MLKLDDRGYRDSFKTSVILGGSQGSTYILGIIRTKALAYLLGPAGIGMVGLYTSILGTVGTFSGFGIGESGIREIAAARGNENIDRLSRTVMIVRRSCLVSGVLGLILCVVLANPLSLQMFGNSEHAVAISVLGFTLLTGAIGGGENALLQGSGRFTALAKMNIFSSLAGILPVVLIYVWFREKGIVPALLLSSVVTLLITWYFSRSIRLSQVHMSWREMIPETKILLSLGFAFMMTGLVGTGKDMIIRSMITKTHGIEATGLYQSAWAISGLFVNFVLRAMGMDFYPRLTAMNGDRKAMIKAVNQQIEIGVLLVIPGVLATITCAPLVLTLLYTSKFASASGLLAVLSCGVFFKIVSYPINTIQLAMGDARGFASVAVLLALVETAMTVVLLNRFGLIGAATAFPVACFIHILAMAFVGHRLIQYKINRTTGTLALTAILMVMVSLLVAFSLKGYTSLLTGFVLTFISLCYSIRELAKRLGRDHRISRIIMRLPIARFLIG